MEEPSLPARQARAAEGRPMLAEVYSWFTEGFETADLCEAAARLEIASP
jgi:hypothetical protein